MVPVVVDLSPGNQGQAGEYLSLDLKSYRLLREDIVDAQTVDISAEICSAGRVSYGMAALEASCSAIRNKCLKAMEGSPSP